MKHQSMFVAAIVASALSSAAFAAQQPQSGSATPSGQAGQPGQSPSTTASATQPSSDAQMTLQGCLQKNKSGGYWLTMAAPSSAAAGATGSTSSQPGTVGTSGSTTTRPTDSASAARQGMVYNLEEMDGKVGNMDLDKHVGHKVEVTGRADDTKSSDKLKAGSGTSPAASNSSAANGDREIDAQDFHIASIKMIEGSCN